MPKTSRSARVCQTCGKPPVIPELDGFMCAAHGWWLGCVACGRFFAAVTEQGQCANCELLAKLAKSRKGRAAA
jgi:hypothetical protein